MARIQHKSAETSVFLCCDKVFSIKSTKGRIPIATKKILSRHYIHNSQQRATKIYRDKDYFCCDTQNMKEVNFLSQQEVEEQNKKSGDKEIFCRDNKSYGMIEFYHDRIKLGRDRN